MENKIKNSPSTLTTKIQLPQRLIQSIARREPQSGLKRGIGGQGGTWEGGERGGVKGRVGSVTGGTRQGRVRRIGAGPGGAGLGGARMYWARRSRKVHRKKVSKKWGDRWKYYGWKGHK